MKVSVVVPLVAVAVCEMVAVGFAASTCAFRVIVGR